MRETPRLSGYHAAVWQEPIILEMGAVGERGIIPSTDRRVAASVGPANELVPPALLRRDPPVLPELAQPQVLRHYLRLSQQTLGMDLGVDIGEGTCTMKYSPKIHEQVARMPQLAELHPEQADEALQGILQITYGLRQFLCEISGMDEFSFQPGGGAQAVFAASCILRAFHLERGESQRDEIITSSFSHPCDAAAPATAGFRVITLPPDEHGLPDIGALRSVVSERTAGLMITNPEDTGIFNPNIDEFTRIVHDAGGLCFQDQANANGILGIARCRDAGFDACHFNLHKTFSSPHGSEGPADGALGVTELLAPYLPTPIVRKDGDSYSFDRDRPRSVGKVRSFAGNLQCVFRAYAWIMSMGADGLRSTAEISVLNNNYLQQRLLEIPGVSMPFAHRPRRLDQVRYSLAQLKEETGVGTEDVRDRMVDFGIQGYWMSHHPWIVPEPFTPEPCETYSKEDCDEWAAVIAQIVREAHEDADHVRQAPHRSTIARIADHDSFEDPGRWAMTWRAFKRKRLGTADRSSSTS